MINNAIEHTKGRPEGLPFAVLVYRKNILKVVYSAVVTNSTYDTKSP
jgi:hypothetical protein